MSKVPLQVLKHLGSPGIICVADFLNKNAIQQLPPAEWQATKVQPIFKGKGNRGSPDNYRSIAITSPFTKIFIASISQRVT